MLHDADLADGADGAADAAGGLAQFADIMQARRGPQAPVFRPVGTRQARPETPDLCSPAGAQLLATRIREFWRNAGFEISIEIFKTGAKFETRVEDRRPVMSLRSNLINALPPRR